MSVCYVLGVGERYGGVQDPFGAFTSLNLRLGINDYEHQEIEPSGEVATDFSNEAWDYSSS